jgi:hypothetical protein
VHLPAWAAAKAVWAYRANDAAQTARDGDAVVVVRFSGATQTHVERSQALGC